MSVSTMHVLHGVKTPNQFYSQIEDATPSPAVERILAMPSGFPEPLFAGVMGLKPVIDFRTPQVSTLLAECGLFGVDLSAGNTDLLYKKVTNKGTREADASTVHTRLRASDAFMYIKSLSAGHQKEASGEVQVCCVYDGTNSPLAPTGSVALTGTPAAAEHFVLGPVSINGSTLDGQVDLSIDWGVKLKRAGSASELYDTFIAIESVEPVVTLTGLAIEHWVNYGLVGTALTSTGLVVYLRKKTADAAAGVATIADGTSAHVKLSGTKGVIVVDRTSGGGAAEARTSLKIHLRAADTSTRSLVIATGQAIT